MPYPWIRFLHIVTAIGFVGIHGASIVVLYAIRNERDRNRIEGILDFSAGTATAMYVSLVAVIGTGIWMGFVRTTLLRQGWYWWSLVLLVITSVLMWFIAKPFTKQIRAATEIRPSGVPRVSDEELAQTLRSPRAHLITAIGVIGLGAILYLMVFQPSLSAGAPATAEPATPTAVAAPTDPDTGIDATLAFGKQLYDETAGGIGCAACHGLDGKGTAAGPNINGVSKSAIADALGRGIPGMDSIKLDPDELEAVYRYVRTLP